MAEFVNIPDRHSIGSTSTSSGFVTVSIVFLRHRFILMGVVRRLLKAYLMTFDIHQLRSSAALHTNICPEISFGHLRETFIRHLMNGVSSHSNLIIKRFGRSTFLIKKKCWSKGSNEMTDIKVTQTTKERFVELFYVFSKRLNALHCR